MVRNKTGNDHVICEFLANDVEDPVGTILGLEYYMCSITGHTCVGNAFVDSHDSRHSFLDSRYSHLNATSCPFFLSRQDADADSNRANQVRKECKSFLSKYSPKRR